MQTTSVGGALSLLLPVRTPALAPIAAVAGRVQIAALAFGGAALALLADGGSRFEPDAHGRHRHLILAPAGRDRLQEAISLLVTQPAAASATAGDSL